MSTITFDTHKFVKELETSGMPTAQVEALLKVQQEILEHTIDNTLATKTDLDKVERKLGDDIKDVKADINLLKWMLGITVGGVMLLILKSFFPA